MAIRLTRIALAAIVLAGVFTGSALAKPTASNGSLTSIATTAGVEIRCYADMDQYFGDANIAPVRYWLGIAGFWGVPQSAWTTDQAKPIVGLTATTCLAASKLKEGVTIARAYAAFTLSHELAHASGIGDETQADCRGAAQLPVVAAQLGLHGAKALAQLEAAAQRSSGYSEIPLSCWRGVSS